MIDPVSPSRLEPPPPEEIPVRGLLGLWIGGSLLQAAILAAQENLPFVFGLAASVPYYGLLALLVVPLWRFSAWLGRRRPSAPVAVLLHALVAIALIAVWQAGYFGLLFLLAGSTPVEEQFAEGGLWLVLQTLTIYALVAVGVVAIQTSRRLRRQQARSVRLQLLAREMEVRSLRAQLRPHFLFNVLNSIYSLIESRPREAERMVELLADLMRSTLELTEEDFIPLEEEMRLVRSYLEIERIRLGSRLSIEWEVDDEIDQVDVPPLVLQPLVENAIKHAAGESTQTCSIEISSRAIADDVEIRVLDDGPGADLPLDEGAGRGLALTRSRLETMYGDGSRLEVANREPNGFEVRVLLPAVAPDLSDLAEHGSVP